MRVWHFLQGSFIPAGEFVNRFCPLGNVHRYVICDVQPNVTVKQQVVRFYRKGED